MDKELYVVAGPNGAGKTSGVKGRIPANIPIINGDLIHFEMFHSHSPSPASSEQAKDAAQTKLKELVEKNASFGYETNLSTREDWKHLKDLQNKGYKINVLFVSVDDTEILQKRINTRVASGEAHYVNPNTVVNRYDNGLKLLDYYFNVPDNLQILDNTEDVKTVLRAGKGNIIFKQICFRNGFQKIWPVDFALTKVLKTVKSAKWTPKRMFSPGTGKCRN